MVITLVRSPVYKFDEICACVRLFVAQKTAYWNVRSVVLICPRRSFVIRMNATSNLVRMKRKDKMIEFSKRL